MFLWVFVIVLFLAILGIVSYVWKLKCSKGDLDCAKISSYKSMPLVHEIAYRQCEKAPNMDEEKDAVDEYLDELSKDLGESEGNARVTRCKIRQTKEEMSNAQVLDEETRNKYMQLISSLRKELDNNEQESRLLQFRIEKVAKKRAELGEQVAKGHKQFKCAAARLAAGLGELHRGRDLDRTKPTHESSTPSLHHRSGPSHRHAHPTESLIKIWTNTDAFLCSNETHYGKKRVYTR